MTTCRGLWYPGAMQAVEGKKAPSFTLMGDDGDKHKLRDLRGQRFVLYFYPRDSTTGCTTEACDFRDRKDQLSALGVKVFGVSKDSLESHERFRDKHELNFVLLSDPDTLVHARYGAWGEKKMYGKVRPGVIRSTYLIDENGVLVKVWKNVRTKGHAERVLTKIEELWS